mmetsp:Transcript_34094/g.45075  ORF Transcript_34094/g.45075 Transcript_34094/m.45075 type:complete len:275 (+) Transcript_34094:86-910(+)
MLHNLLLTTTAFLLLLSLQQAFNFYSNSLSLQHASVLLQNEKYISTSQQTKELGVPRRKIKSGYRKNNVVCQLTVKEAQESELSELASFFVKEFFKGDDLKPGQVRTLERDQYRDFCQRYGPLLKQKLETSLLVAKDKKQIKGCIGIDVVPCKGEKIGAKSNSLEEVELRPVMSNLVVAKTARKRGLGKKLIRQAESKTKSWGYKELLLLVDKENIPAQKLYKKMGYSVLFEDKTATKLVPDKFQIKTIPSTNICMRKNIGGVSLFGNLFGIFN